MIRLGAPSEQTVGTRAFAGIGKAVLVGLSVLLFAPVSCRLLQPAQKARPPGAAARRAGIASLLEAAERGELSRVRELLADDPSLLNARDGSGWNALGYAAWNGRHQVCEYLLERGAEGDLFTEAACGPLDSFRERLRTNPLGVSSRDRGRKATALLWAVRGGNRVGCELLLAMGADIQAADKEGNTALHYAASLEKMEILELLAAAGAGPDSANANGQTPLHLAAARGSFEVCLFLLDHGASLDRPDGKGNTALHLAAARGEFELCEYFLARGAEADLRNDSGQTPLDLAERGGYQRVSELLRVQMGR
jgi:ankyrin repeat protein